MTLTRVESKRKNGGEGESYTVVQGDSTDGLLRSLDIIRDEIVTLEVITDRVSFTTHL